MRATHLVSACRCRRPSPAGSRGLASPAGAGEGESTQQPEALHVWVRAVCSPVCIAAVGIKHDGPTRGLARRTGRRSMMMPPGRCCVAAPTLSGACSARWRGAHRRLHGAAAAGALCVGGAPALAWRPLASRLSRSCCPPPALPLQPSPPSCAAGAHPRRHCVAGGGTVLKRSPAQCWRLPVWAVGRVPVALCLCPVYREGWWPGVCGCGDGGRASMLARVPPRTGGGGGCRRCPPWRVSVVSKQGPTRTAVLGVRRQSLDLQPRWGCVGGAFICAGKPRRRNRLPCVKLRPSGPPPSCKVRWCHTILTGEHTLASG